MFYVKTRSTHETIAICSRLRDARALLDETLYITEEL